MMEIHLNVTLNVVDVIDFANTAHIVGLVVESGCRRRSIEFRFCGCDDVLPVPP